MPPPAVGNDGGDLATRYAHGTFLPRQEDECTNDSECSRLRSYKSFQIRFKIFLPGYITCPFASSVAARSRIPGAPVLAPHGRACRKVVTVHQLEFLVELVHGHG